MLNMIGWMPCAISYGTLITLTHFVLCGKKFFSFNVKVVALNWQSLAGKRNWLSPFIPLNMNISADSDHILKDDVAMTVTCGDSISISSHHFDYGWFVGHLCRASRFVSIKIPIFQFPCLHVKTRLGLNLSAAKSSPCHLFTTLSGQWQLDDRAITRHSRHLSILFPHPPGSCLPVTMIPTAAWPNLSPHCNHFLCNGMRSRPKLSLNPSQSRLALLLVVCYRTFFVSNRKRQIQSSRSTMMHMLQAPRTVMSCRLYHPIEGTESMMK